MRQNVVRNASACIVKHVEMVRADARIHAGIAMFVDGCMHLCEDVCMDVHRPVHKRCSQARANMCADMWIDMFIQLCIDM